MKKGFTLIEMLIAIVVIGMLIGILIGVFGNPMKEATVKSGATELLDAIRLVDDAEEYHYTVYGSYATRTEILEKGILKKWPQISENVIDETGPTCIWANSVIGATDFQIQVIPQHAIPDGQTQPDGITPLKTETYILSFCPKAEYVPYYEKIRTGY